MDGSQRDDLRGQTRRAFLGRCGLGLGAIALGELLAGDGRAEEHRGRGDPMAPRVPHFAPRARRVLYLHMAGSPSQHELFENKPALARHDLTPCPAEYLKGERFAFIQGQPLLLGPRFPFQRCGQSGIEVVTELLPHFSARVDQVCFIRSMVTDQFNHAPAQLLLHTGDPRFGHAAMGSWVTYGLGSASRDLPGFVVLVSGGNTPDAGKSVWGSGFLPSVYQGVQCRSAGEPVLFVANPPGVDAADRGRTLEAIKDLDGLAYDASGDPETLARIAQYELAFRMQTAVPEVMDIGRESPATLELYGATPGSGSFACNCLLARRLLEAGVRFVQLYDWGWDLHGTAASDDLLHQLPKKAAETDRPIAALLIDLERRGLLDETLVVWGGEFGRTPMVEYRGGNKTFLGRDHHPHAFTMWLAGAGVRSGHVHGATDDLGYYVTADPVHVHDLQATVLHLLGLDHERLTFKHAGLERTLTGVTRKSRVVAEILA